VVALPVRSSLGQHLEDDWLTKGHNLIGQRVRRSILDEAKTLSADVDGSVVGWLPANVSNYFKDHDPSKAAALWRVQYDSVGIGQEDLELHEVMEASRMYESGVKNGGDGGSASTPLARASVPALAAPNGSVAAGKMAAPAMAETAAVDEWWTSGETPGYTFVAKRLRYNKIKSSKVCLLLNVFMGGGVVSPSYGGARSVSLCKIKQTPGNKYGPKLEIRRKLTFENNYQALHFE